MPFGHELKAEWLRPYEAYWQRSVVPPVEDTVVSHRSEASLLAQFLDLLPGEDEGDVGGELRGTRLELQEALRLSMIQTPKMHAGISCLTRQEHEAMLSQTANPGRYL
jgi:hypothetical protein